MILTPPNKASEMSPSHLRPVRFVDTQKSSDTYGMQTRLMTIINALIENQKKWESAEVRGSSICSAIEVIKSKILDTKSSSSVSMYPEELKSYCDKLAIELSTFNDVLENAKESLSQLKSISESNSKKDEIPFRSWTLDHFVKFAEFIVVQYDKEYEIKKSVTEKIAHSKNTSELALHSMAMSYPFSVDEYFKMRFRYLSAETQKK